MPEKLAGMSIHSEIKRLRLSKNWSHTDLANEVSRLEGISKPLNWQTVQQWEKEEHEKGTAPKRNRMPFVAQALGTTVEALLAGAAPDPDAEAAPYGLSERALKLAQEFDGLSASAAESMYAVVMHMIQVAGELGVQAATVALPSVAPTPAPSSERQGQ